MDDHGHSPRLDAGSSSNGRLARRAIVVAIGVLALCVAAPAFASARVEWKLNSVPVGESTAVEWSGKLNVTDTETLLGLQTVECSDKVEGTVGAGGAGEVTKVTASGCTGVVDGAKCSNVEPTTGITALNLPWHTELVSSGGALHYALVSGGKGTPSLEVQCRVDGIKTVDTCTGKLGATTSNGESGVTTAFITTEKLSCSQSKAETGFASGSGSILAKVRTLSVANEEPPVWQVEGIAIAKERVVEWKKARLTLLDWTDALFYGTLGVACEDTAEGVLGTGGTGSITKIKLSKCERSIESECKGEYSLEATNLPWHTELFSGRSTVGDLISSGGSGRPGFTLKCEVNGLRGTTDKCEGVPTLSVTNNTERGVFAAFESERFHCSLDNGGSFGTIYESRQTLDLNNGEALAVS